MFNQPEPGPWSGIGLTLLLHMVQIPILAVAFSFPSMFFLLSAPMFIGVSQLLYIIPAILIAKKKGELHIVKGLIIGASITFLLNAACLGLFFGGGGLKF